MPKLLQINECLNLSTGKIAQQIGELTMSQGWDSWIAYSGREQDTSCNSHKIKVGTLFDACVHYAGHRLFDKEGLLSKKYTKYLIDRIDEIRPDLIQLHNLHDHWLNYPLLFDYLASLNIPIVWTQHDCWAFTGGCAYYSMLRCSQYRTECIKCPQKRSFLCEKSNYQFNNKRKHISQIKNLTIVPVSTWLEGEVRKSFLKNQNIYTICNGVDIKSFKPSDSSSILQSYGLEKKKYVIGVASIWDERKNLNDYVELSAKFNDICVVLVGLTRKQIKNMPKNVVGIPRTQNVDELASLYSGAIAVLNLSKEETFGLTTAEGLACGTPGIVYNCTASPELVSSDTGFVVEEGDIDGLVLAIKKLRESPLYSFNCRARAERLYDKNKCFSEYIKLYNSLIHSQMGGVTWIIICKSKPCSTRWHRGSVVERRAVA